MPSILGLFSADADSRRELSLLAGEAGYGVHSSSRLAEALDILRDRRPDVMLIVDSENGDGAQAAREILRAAPLTPVVAAAKRRDASRAVELMRLGVCEVIPPPWTRESVEACLAKSLRAQGTIVSLKPRPKARRAPLYFFALAGFLALCFAVLSARLFEREKELRAIPQVNSWDLPYRHPSGLAFDGKNFWVSDWFSQSFYVHSLPDLKIVRLIHFTNETPLGVLFAQGSTWRLSASGIITRSMNDDKLTVLEKYNSAGPGTIAMAYDGVYLWTLDNHHILHKHIFDTDLSEIASYRCPDPDPSSVAYDGRTLWLLDSSDRELVRLNLDRPEEALSFMPLTEYANGLYRPVALAWDGRNFWTVGEKNPHGAGPARLFRHPMGKEPAP